MGEDRHAVGDRDGEGEPGRRRDDRVGFGGVARIEDDCHRRAVNLGHVGGGRPRKARDRLPVLRDGLGIVSDGERNVEARIGALARAPIAGGEERPDGEPSVEFRHLLRKSGMSSSSLSKRPPGTLSASVSLSF